MKFRIIAASLLAVALLASCKKDEVEKVSMDGTLKLAGTIPSFVEPGDKYTFTASGVTAPDGTAVAYYFRNPVTQKLDTTTTFTYTVPDSLGTFTISCVAYPVESSDKYYTSSKSVKFTVVGPRSLSGIPIYPEDGKAVLFGRSYPTFKVGGREWTGFNLTYSDGKVGMPYSGAHAMLELLGGFYTWEQAQGICPEGWHLPSEEEWVELLVAAGAPADLQPYQDAPCGAGNLMVKATFNRDAMWEYYRDVNIRNTTHMSAISAGYAIFAEDYQDYMGFGSYAAFWTSAQMDGKGVYRYIYQEFDNVYVGLGDKDSFAASVRCVR